MSHFKLKKEIFNRPIRLTEQDEKDPVLTFDEFFTNYSLSEVRQINQDMDQACLTSDTPPYDDPEERAALLNYREYEEKVLEAAFIIYQTDRAKPKATQNTDSHTAELQSPKPPADTPPARLFSTSILSQYPKLDALARGLSALQVDVAALTEIIVPAWCEEVLAETNQFLSGSPQQDSSEPKKQLIDLKDLKNRVLQLQNRTAKLCRISLEMLSRTVPR